jgi:membrane fusion protein (multidrug efflux system)
MGKEMEKAGPPPETVSTGSSREETWEATLSAVGSITGAKGVAISNEVPGVVTRIHFDSGKVVKAGDVLVELDTSVERAQLASAQARVDYATLTANRTRQLVATSALAKAQEDADNAQLRSATTDRDAIYAQMARKVVRAPFAGKLGIRAVNLGQYLNPGTRLTSLEAVDTVYVDFSLPQQKLASVAVGTPVRVALEGGDAFDGSIAAIDPTVDQATRSLKLRASVPNQEDKLRPGMFATVSVVLPGKTKVVIVPRTAIVHASYGDSLYVVEDKDGKKVARQQFVKLGEQRGDFVAITDGLPAGKEVVIAGGFKLRNGAPVVVNNTVKPDPQLDPHPTNR